MGEKLGPRWEKRKKKGYGGGRWDNAGPAHFGCFEAREARRLDRCKPDAEMHEREGNWQEGCWHTQTRTPHLEVSDFFLQYLWGNVHWVGNEKAITSGAEEETQHRLVVRHGDAENRHHRGSRTANPMAKMTVLWATTKPPELSDKAKASSGRLASSRER